MSAKDSKLEDVTQEMTSHMNYGKIIATIIEIYKENQSAYWQSDSYTIACKACNYTLSNVSSDSLLITPRIHLLYHKTTSKASGDNSYSYSSRGLYAFTKQSNDNFVYVRINTATEAANQCLLINPAGTTAKEFHPYIYNNYGHSLAPPEDSVVPLGSQLNEYMIAPPHSEYMDAYIQAMMDWCYVCVLCGDEYESGLPSIDSVALHVRTSCSVLRAGAC